MEGERFREGIVARVFRRVSQLVPSGGILQTVCRRGAEMRGAPVLTGSDAAACAKAASLMVRSAFSGINWRAATVDARSAELVWTEHACDLWQRVVIHIQPPSPIPFYTQPKCKSDIGTHPHQLSKRGIYVLLRTEIILLY